jgi:hypothetical protein
MAFIEPLPSTVRLFWGSIELQVTGMQYSRSAAAEVDITSMGVVGGSADTVVQDDFDSGHVMVIKSIDYGVLDPGSLSIDYYDVGQLTEAHVGMKRQLVVAGSPEDTAPTRLAFLAELGSQYKSGEFVVGNATFKFTDR